MSKLFIPIILGTAREGRRSEQVAQFLLDQFKLSEEIETELVDVKDHLFGYTHPSWEEYEVTNAWRSIAQRMDGIVLIVPEYNHSYPGELKILLDSALGQYENKPVLIVGVSSGSFGGVRAIEHITPVLVRIGLKPLGARNYLSFPNVEEAFNEGGSIKDEFYLTKVPELRDLLIRNAKVLKELRVQS